MKCEWCNEEVESPAKAHVSPPCEKAPIHIKRKWEKEKPLRDRIDSEMEIVARVARSI